MHATPTPTRYASLFRLLVFASCVFALAGCGAGQVVNTPPPPAKSVRFGHVFIVVEENQNYANVVASASMPYFNSLANRYGLATNYFANGHPSIPNYFELTAGQTLTIIDALTDVTGVFCTSGSEREFTLEGSWYADEEIQAGADRNAATAD